MRALVCMCGWHPLVPSLHPKSPDVLSSWIRVGLYAWRGHASLQLSAFLSSFTTQETTKAKESGSTDETRRPSRPPSLAIPSPMKRLSRMGSQAKRAGRSKDSFTYHISDMSANGNLVTETVSTGLVVRLWRNGKFFESSASAMTDDHVSWEDSALCVPCTLYASKTGKQYSDKFYNVSILAR